MMTESSKAVMKATAAPEGILVGKSAKSPNSHVGVPLVGEVQLTAATGGAELSCYRCMVPFGVVVLIAGVVVTTIAYSFNTHGSTISVLGLVLLSAGLLLLAASATCWKVGHERKKQQQRRESQAALMAARGNCIV
ncbi:transmembrane protein 100 [Megalops cyprinoides]|uniref:transmembrane protein 100 n=1 Tax=Megalops cyprinoides TaxID=118141 RepID=UPI001864D2A5|nr:transmembrane protein 100 [Megalops cyprinoides]